MLSTSFLPTRAYSGVTSPSHRLETRGGQQRHRNHDPPHTDLAGVLPHQFTVGHALGTPDLEDDVPVGLHTQPVNEVSDDIADRDRLGRCPDPPRRDHHWKPVDQIADQFEGERSRADDDRGAELDGGRAVAGENGPDFVAARQVG